MSANNAAATASNHNQKRKYGKATPDCAQSDPHLAKELRHYGESEDR